jgi:short-subunit dehydrogenase
MQDQGQLVEFSETNIYRELSIIQLYILISWMFYKTFFAGYDKKRKGRILISHQLGKSPGPLILFIGTKAFVQSFIRL